MWIRREVFAFYKNSKFVKLAVFAFLQKSEHTRRVHARVMHALQTKPDRTRDAPLLYAVPLRRSHSAPAVAPSGGKPTVPLVKLVARAATSNDPDPREVKRQLAAHVKDQFRRVLWKVQPENGCCGALWMWVLHVDRLLFQTARPTCPDVYEALPEELKEIVGCGVDSPYVIRVDTYDNIHFTVCLHFEAGKYPKELPRLTAPVVSRTFVRQWMADRRAQKAAEAPPVSATHGV